MKATIEAPVERKVTLEITENEAKILKELCNWVGSSELKDEIWVELHERGITEDKLDDVIEDIWETLKEVL